ncbi:copia protein [Tanacetum coccineum]
MASEQLSSGLGPKLLTPRTISLGLVQNIPSSTPYVPPTKNEWEILFKPMFDEYLNPPTCVDPQVPAVIAPEPVVSTNTPSSTTIDQDAPSTSNSQTNQETPYPVLPLGVEEADHDIEVIHMDNNPYVDFPILKLSFEESSSQVVILNNLHSVNQPPEHINKWSKDHPVDNLIGDPSRAVFTRHQLQDAALFCYFDAFLSSVEPKSYKEALTKSCWVEAMQEELNEFKHLEVWELVPRPDRVMIITLKWKYKEVYGSQPDGFIDPENPNHVYKLKKALYGLKQAPRAWYDLLSSFLLSQKFSKGTIDPTLFIKREGKDILLMSMMGKLSFFLGLQISQSPRGFLLNQSKYALESLKKYGMETCDPVNTLMVEKSKLNEDPQGKVVDPTRYHGMIGTLIYLTSNRPDLVFAVCMCARYQAKPIEKHLHAMLTMRAAKIPENVRLEIPLYCDNESAIALCCNNVQHSRSKHIEIRYHFIKEQVENGVVELYFVRTQYQLADIFTKPLARERLAFLINKLGMRSMSPQTLKTLADEEEE